jgi:hypothetical protein
MRWMILAAALAGACPAVAAPAGAPGDAGMAPGGWGPDGWREKDTVADPMGAAVAPDRQGPMMPA